MHKRKIIFNPHIAGMGHRARCNLIAKKLKEIEPSVKIKFLLRRDDPIPPEKWLEFDFVKNKWHRSYEIVTSKCLVEDGILPHDFRIKILSKMGGKIVAICKPYGFVEDYSTVKRLLDITHIILVPWPKKIFQWPKELSEIENKIRRVEPILNLPEEFSTKKTKSNNIYVSISRETERIFPIIQMTVKNLKNEIPNLNLNILSSYKDFKDASQHIKTIMSSDLVIAQGTTTLFETCYLGIPRICLPLPSAEEQMIVGNLMRDEGAALSIPINELNVEKLSNAILDIFNNPSIKNDMIAKGRKLVPKSGLDDAAKLILQVLV